LIKNIDFTTANLVRAAFDVLCGDIVILKRAVAPELVLEARRAVHEWGLSVPQSKAHPRESGGASHLASYLPARSQSRYIFHSFEFEPLSSIPIVERVLPIFEALLDIYCKLIGERIAFGENYSGYSFLPACIHYPRGGGFFQEHTHPLMPQRIGLILSGSSYGHDYKIGGGRFCAQDKTWMATEGHHDLGDLTLFRYDLGHDITPIDPDVPLDWTRNDGRWSFVLPLKPIGKK